LARLTVGYLHFGGHINSMLFMLT